MNRSKEYNRPKYFDFLPHYKGDGLKPFAIKLKYRTGNPVDLAGCLVAMQLKLPGSEKVHFEFNSEGLGDSKLEVNSEGVILFPLIDSWNLARGSYNYDLQVIDTFGFTRTYLRGAWRVNQDITVLK